MAISLRKSALFSAQMLKKLSNVSLTDITRKTQMSFRRTMCAPADTETQEMTELEKELSEKLEASNNELMELKDKYHRVLADRENVRTRLMKEVADTKVYGIQKFSKELLEVFDVFKYAIQSVPKESIKPEDAVLKNLYEGVVGTEAMLKKTFRHHGLTEFTPQEGDKFDAALHECVFPMPANGNEPGTIGSVLRSGWMLGDRCLRSSQVGVHQDS